MHLRGTAVVMIMRYVGQPSHTTFKSDEHMDVSLAQKRTADLEWFEDTE